MEIVECRSFTPPPETSIHTSRRPPRAIAHFSFLVPQHSVVSRDMTGRGGGGGGEV